MVTSSLSTVVTLLGSAGFGESNTKGMQRSVDLEINVSYLVQG